MPTVSVIVPAYNAEKTLSATLASLQAQTWQDFEVIVINDGSTDRTVEIVESFQEPRFHVYSYPNGGLSTARNRGIQLAEGEFISFLDADDLWSIDKLELQVEALKKHPEAGVAYSFTCFMAADGKSYHVDRPISYQGNVYANLLVSNFLASGSNLLVRREAIEAVGEFDSEVSGAADWDYYLRLAAHCPFALVPKPQIFYRQSSGSMSSKVEYMEECQLKVIDRAFHLAPVELQQLKHQSLAYIYQYSCELYLRKASAGEVGKAMRKLLQAIQLKPQILLHSKTQRLAIKIAILKLPFSEFFSYLMKRANILRSRSMSEG